MKKKKKTKKKTKKKVTKKSRRKVRRISPERLLMVKMHNIRERVPYVKPTGEQRDPDTDELLFPYTEAQEVFKIYREQCDIENLRFRSYADDKLQPTIVSVRNMPCLLGFFCIEDMDTGARFIGWGTGMGDNGPWAANTAGTRALKQFLLLTFEPTWEDPSEEQKLSKRELEQQVRNELIADGTMGVIDQMKDFFSKPPKGESDVTKRQNPTNRTRRRS